MLNDSKILIFGKIPRNSILVPATSRFSRFLKGPLNQHETVVLANQHNSSVIVDILNVTSFKNNINRLGLNPLQLTDITALCTRKFKVELPNISLKQLQPQFENIKNNPNNKPYFKHLNEQLKQNNQDIDSLIKIQPPLFTTLDLNRTAMLEEEGVFKNSEDYLINSLMLKVHDMSIPGTVADGCFSIILSGSYSSQQRLILLKESRETLTRIGALPNLKRHDKERLMQHVDETDMLIANYSKYIDQDINMDNMLPNDFDHLMNQLYKNRNSLSDIFKDSFDLD